MEPPVRVTARAPFLVIDGAQTGASFASASQEAFYDA